MKDLSDQKLLEVKGLKTHFFTKRGHVKSVDGVSFSLNKGETIGIVGESGCGKSVTSLSIMKLVPEPPGKIVDGEIMFKGQDLTKLSFDEMTKIRGNEISMIFQEPMTSLNPVYTIGYQITEAVKLHRDVTGKEALEIAIDMLKKVGIPSPEQRVNEFPHQLSGGMRQRAMIAMALSCQPELLIADEPTTALDVTIQAQILELINSLKKDLDMAVMMITHDLGVVAEVADKVLVMYAGKVMEYTDTRSLFSNPSHPYTWGLMRSLPRMDVRVKRLQAIPGMVPSPLDFPKGCKYHTRCPLATSRCMEEEPELKEICPGHKVRCWFPEKLQELKVGNEDKLNGSCSE